MSPAQAKQNLPSPPGEASICTKTQPDHSPRRSTQPTYSRVRAGALGLTASGAVVGFYLGLITLTSDWFNARAQFTEYRSWVLALALGLGLQVSLFVYLRSALAAARMRGAASSVAASGGMSGVAMALCCSHYLATVLPAIGLPFLSGAVAGLAEHQTLFFSLGVLSNLLGLAYLLWVMKRSGIGSIAVLLRTTVSPKGGRKEAIP